MSDTPPRKGLRPETPVVISFAVATLAGLSLFVAYATTQQNTILEGTLLFLCLGGIGMGMILWNRRLLPHDDVENEHHTVDPAARAKAIEELNSGTEELGRRRLVARMFGVAGGALGLGLLLPVFSLGPSPGDDLFVTPWRKGLRVVDENGRLIKADDLQIGGSLTVFPEGYAGSNDGQAQLVRIDPAQLKHSENAVKGNVIFSKICTHVGCPVGLYDKRTMQLICPCHRSTFQMNDGAKVVFGPAPRPLPQLPISEDRDGYLVALGDFPEPVGPGFWNMNKPPASAQKADGA